jgi:uncharacterized protein (TIGR03437 family)
VKHLFLCRERRLTLLTFAIFTPLLQAQAPTGLTVKTATNKRVDLSWSGTAANYSIQRRTLGGSYSTIAGSVAASTYSDTSIDAYTTYQYQIVANLASGSSTPSNQVTMGPPPAGFTNAVPAPGPPGSTVAGYFGYDLTMCLDGNGDPAFAFIFYDPNTDSNNRDSRVEFRSWNRALYKWNDLVHAVNPTGGDTTSTFTPTLSLAYDPSTSTYALAASLVNPDDSSALGIFTSTDNGLTWTKKTTYAGAYIGSLSLLNGNIHLVYTIDATGMKYVTGQLSANPSTWTTKSEVRVSGVSISRFNVMPSLALDSAGAPAVAYWSEASSGTFNAILMFWKPAGATAPVKIMDSQNRGSDELAIKLAFNGLNPRVLAYVQRADADFGVGLHTSKSDNGGSTWSTPVVIPPDGNSSTDFPFDLAIDSQGRGAAVFGQNGSSGDQVCGNPKVARTTDFNSWKTCDAVNNVQVTGNYTPYPEAIQGLFGGNDKLYMIWWDSDGVDMYREPPAGAASAPNISGVVNGATFQTGIVAGSWTTIQGANLSDVSRTWGDSDFNNGNILPTNLSGVSVKINGLDAAVYYISPGQINVQAPANINGNVSVVVTRNGVASNTFTASAVSTAPGLFSYAAGGKNYPSALFNGTFTIVGDPALIGGGVVAKAKAGDIIQLYATGLGSSPAGNIIGSPISFSGTVTATLGSTNAQVLGAALVAVGEFQVNIQIPSGLADGEYPITIKVGNTSSQSGVIIPITH